MATVGRRYVFSGQVQGVGFRMTAVQFSRGLKLCGTVRNMEDGSVELVLVGTGPEMDVLVSRLREHYGAFIRNVTEDVAPAGRMAKGVHVVY